jgi:predicted TIM-barrel fold metal-dependent hydrolase
MRVDSHAHVFRRDLPLVAGHRHAPEHDALLPDLLGVLERWIPDGQARATILGATPRQLFGFDQEA